MSITSAVSAAVESISIWLNPDKKERIILRKAIYAAEELLRIERKEGIYTGMSEHKRIEYLRHYQKQFDAWKDGQS